jgi:hypothetical protein
VLGHHESTNKQSTIIMSQTRACVWYLCVPDTVLEYLLAASGVGYLEPAGGTQLTRPAYFFRKKADRANELVQVL